MSDSDQPIPAATLVVMRETTTGAPELLMAERAAAMRFAGGALVFPGGRIDLGDHALAAHLPGDAEDNAARIAAVRETLEEAGLAIGCDCDAAAIPEGRAMLHDGVPFGEVLARIGGRLRLDALVPYARWLPPSGSLHRIFDTRFYLAAAPTNLPEPSADGSENTRIFWASAQAVLDDADAGRATIIYPTRRNLERLVRYASFDEARADAAAHEVRTISPWIEPRDGVDHLCIPEGLGYPVTAERLDRAVRA
ncbi:NUDIX domain-containing protein [Sphingomonas sp.]|uniref:NUDIX hydrolase n=1 Tax=Sphingomonas sp. TaxID=28214 RepID=UPI001B008A34|nr:NUDIX domain-containing protein [Sphingomonas sp.]MBO9714515.1 NUDIX domain-containing protein [Sphingomonas sp.]